MQNALHVARRQEVGKLCDREQANKGVERHFRGESDKKNVKNNSIIITLKNIF